MNLQRYALSREHVEHLQSAFTKVLDGCRLRTIRSSGARRGVVDGTGCYVWVMRLDSSSYSVYVGRTSSIVRRVNDYSGDFQVQSPNDFKMRLVEEALGERFPNAVFDLYFAAFSLAECNAREKSLIDLLRPLVNSLPKPTPEERALVESAYRTFYSSIVSRHLSDDT